MGRTGVSFIPCGVSFIPCGVSLIPCGVSFIPCGVSFIPCRVVGGSVVEGLMYEKLLENPLSANSS